MLLLVPIASKANEEPTYTDYYSFASCMYVAKTLGETSFMWKYTDLLETKYTNQKLYAQLYSYSADMLSYGSYPLEVIFKECKELKY